MSQKVTAGRDNLGDLAPQFAALNDDVLFWRSLGARSRIIAARSQFGDGFSADWCWHFRQLTQSALAKST